MKGVLEGKAPAAALREKIRSLTAELSASGRPPLLAVIVAGNDPASLYYAGLLERSGKKEGIEVSVKHIRETTTAELTDLVSTLSANPEVDAILLQMPLPRPVDKRPVMGAVSPGKDVDGQTPENLGLLASGFACTAPATARAVVKILIENGISISGKKAVVIGRSTAVGLPSAMLLLRENATVTLCHSRTEALEEQTREADIVVASAGVPGLIGSGHIKPGGAVVDVGTTPLPDGGIAGDVRFEEVSAKALVSPVKGGVGALTLACLLENTFELYRKNILGKRT